MPKRPGQANGLAVLCLAAACAYGAEAPSAGVVAVTQVTVIGMTGEAPKPDRTVILQGKRIAQVGPASAVAVPRGAQILNGRGRYLIPGLWDMHAHTSSPDRDMALYLANGITGVRDMGGEAPGNPARSPGSFSLPWAELRPLREAVRAGRLRGPRMVAAGVMLDGPEPWPGTLPRQPGATRSRSTGRHREHPAHRRRDPQRCCHRP